MSLGGEQPTRERQGTGPTPDPERAGPTLAAETVPLRDAGQRELDRRREERVRLVVAGSRRRRGPRLRTAVIVLAAVLGCTGLILVLAGGSAVPHRAPAAASFSTPHPIVGATGPAHALEVRRRGARRRAVTRAHRRAARQRRLLADRHARAKARRKERAAARRSGPAHAAPAQTADEETAAREEAAATEEAAPVAEGPTVAVTPEPTTFEPSTSSGGEGQAQKEFGFER